MKENETSMQKSKVIRNQSTQNKLDRIRSDLKTQTPIQFRFNKNKNETQNTKSFKGQQIFNKRKNRQSGWQMQSTQKSKILTTAMYSEKQSTQKSGARFSRTPARNLKKRSARKKVKYSEAKKQSKANNTIAN
jgi:hypothetical protein